MLLNAKQYAGAQLKKYKDHLCITSQTQSVQCRRYGLELANNFMSAKAVHCADISVTYVLSSCGAHQSFILF